MQKVDHRDPDQRAGEIARGLETTPKPAPTMTT